MSNFCLENGIFKRLFPEKLKFKKMPRKSKFFVKLPEKIKISRKFAWKIEILLTRIHDPPDLKLD